MQLQSRLYPTPISSGQGDCMRSDWSGFSDCTATCGKLGTKQRQRIVTHSSAAYNLNCTDIIETIGCNLKECVTCTFYTFVFYVFVPCVMSFQNPMTKLQQTVSNVLQPLGCTWLFVCCGSSVVISFLLGYTVDNVYWKL